ncbi:MAG: GvpL/GvpF family gas vesicle protein [Gemmatimonadetes bacterium]|nr:GvpL/GvpF family gas vesicle protein [Gemmatimonadota bacterium]
MSDLLYLYGFVPADAPTPPEGLTGIAGREVEALHMDGFGALVSRVPSEEYAPDVVESSMRDLGWVGDQGALHERVVTWYVDHGHIVPVRLLTLYSGEEALRREAGARAPGVRERLEATRGLREWDLKVAYRASVLRENLGDLSDEVAALDRELAAADPGRRYLLERKRDKRLKDETGRTARRLARETLDAARAHAVEVRELPPPRAGAEIPVVLNAALLVRREEEDGLRRVLGERGRSLADVGVTAELTGPWAPYRFIEAAADAPAEGESV